MDKAMLLEFERIILYFLVVSSSLLLGAGSPQRNHIEDHTYRPENTTIFALFFGNNDTSNSRGANKTVSKDSFSDVVVNASDDTFRPIILPDYGATIDNVSNHVVHTLSPVMKHSDDEVIKFISDVLGGTANLLNGTSTVVPPVINADKNTSLGLQENANSKSSNTVTLSATLFSTMSSTTSAITSSVSSTTSTLSSTTSVSSSTTSSPVINSNSLTVTPDTTTTIKSPSIKSAGTTISSATLTPSTSLTFSVSSSTSSTSSSVTGNRSTDSSSTMKIETTKVPLLKETEGLPKSGDSDNAITQGDNQHYGHKDVVLIGKAGGNGLGKSNKVMAFFFLAVVLVIVSYIIYHNRNKLLGFVLEGRNELIQARQQQQSKVSNGKQYDRLSTAEEGREDGPGHTLDFDHETRETIKNNYIF